MIDVHRQNAGPMERGVLMTALHRSGHEVPVEIALGPLSGAVKATVAMVRDVTERLATAAQLVEAETRLDVLDDRDRIARELHDSVIQRLFAAGLHLQASTNRPDTTERVSVVVDEIDDAIREIRGVIFTLHRPAGFDSGLEAALRASIDEASRLLGHRPTLKLGGILSNISHDLGTELLAVLREAMTNVAKHAHADKDGSVARCRDRCGDARRLRRRHRHVIQGAMMPGVLDFATSKNGHRDLAEKRRSFQGTRGGPRCVGPRREFGSSQLDRDRTAKTAASVRLVIPSFIRIDDM